jgi:Gametolysin peptidase M11
MTPDPSPRCLHRVGVLAALALCTLLTVFSAAALAKHSVTVTGKLEVAHQDDFAHLRSHDTYFVRRSGGHRFQIRFRGTPPSVRPGSIVKVTGEAVNGALLPSGSGSASRLAVLAPAQPAAVSGQRKVGVILFNFQDDQRQPFTPDEVRKYVFSIADAANGSSIGSANMYYYENSYFRLSLTGVERPDGDVLGWYTIPSSAAPCNYDQWAWDARQQATNAGHDMFQYEKILFIFPQNPDCPWGGVSYIGGNHSWINGGGRDGHLNTYVITHELGHSFGLYHASSLSCTDAAGQRVSISNTCTVDEYGDTHDVMGYWNTRHLNVVHKGELGWITAATTQTVTAPGSYTVAPQEYSWSGTPAIRIPRARNAAGQTLDFYYLEWRRPYFNWFDYYNYYEPADGSGHPLYSFRDDPVYGGVGVRIAPGYGAACRPMLIDATPNTPTFDDAPLMYGRTFSDPDTGVSFTVTGLEQTGATVRVDSLSNGNAAPLPC